MTGDLCDSIRTFVKHQERLVQVWKWKDKLKIPFNPSNQDLLWYALITLQNWFFDIKDQKLIFFLIGQIFPGLQAFILWGLKLMYAF